MTIYDNVPHRYEHLVQLDFTDPDSDSVHPAATQMDYESANVADNEIVFALEALSTQFRQQD